MANAPALPQATGIKVGDFDPLTDLALKMNLPMCSAMSDDEFFCTRAAGHDEAMSRVPHVACGRGHIARKVWRSR